MLAPISGIVIHRGVEIGEVVASGLSGLSGGTVMFEIGDPSQMIVRGDIAEIDIAKLGVGQSVDIVVDAYPDTTYEGRVRWIAPVGLKQQGSAIVTFDTEIDVVDHDPRLRQGMSCDIDIIFTRRDSVPYLPSETVIETFDDEHKDAGEVKGRRGRFLTYVLQADSSQVDTLQIAAEDSTISLDSADSSMASPSNDVTADSSAAVDSTATAATTPPPPTKFSLQRFEEVTLEIGLETSTRIEILSGLQAGDRVATDPQLISRKLEELAATDASDGD